jgi:leucyl aminopeptidase
MLDKVIWFLLYYMKEVMMVWWIIIGCACVWAIGEIVSNNWRKLNEVEEKLDYLSDQTEELLSRLPKEELEEDDLEDDF